MGQRYEKNRKSVSENKQTLERLQTDKDTLQQEYAPLHLLDGIQNLLDDEATDAIQGVRAVGEFESQRIESETDTAEKEKQAIIGDINNEIAKLNAGLEKLRRSGIVEFGKKEIEKSIVEYKKQIDSFQKLIEDLPRKDDNRQDWNRTSLSASEERILSEMIENGEVDIPTATHDWSDPIKNTPHIPTSSGVFSGTTFIPNDPIALEMIEARGFEGVEYINGEPDFSPFCSYESSWGLIDCQVEIGHMTDHRSNPTWEFGRRPTGSGHDPNYDLGNFAQADNALLAMLRSRDETVTLDDVLDFKSNNHLTWHECADGKTMQLVPTIIHNACRHSGGVSEMRYRMAFGNIENEA